jgi:hypothetical protein
MATVSLVGRYAAAGNADHGAGRGGDGTDDRQPQRHARAAADLTGSEDGARERPRQTVARLPAMVRVATGG